jgi:endonuclease/exonuclease/phosphatase (EEP) superfamily protein YafD
MRHQRAPGLWLAYCVVSQLPGRRTSAWAKATIRLLILALLALTWGLLAISVVATAARWIDVAFSPLVLIQTLSPLAAPVALGALCGVLLPMRRVGRIVVAGLCLLILSIHAAIWLPWLTAEQPSPGEELTIMTVSLLHGRADMGKVGDEVRAEGVDLLVLTEVTDTAVTNLQAAGVYRQLPFAVPSTPSGVGTVIRSRRPLMPMPSNGSTAVSPRNPAAGLRTGRRLIVRAVHPLPPVSARVHRWPTRTHVRQWRATFNQLTTWAQGIEGPLIMAGDFNASIDHPGMRQLLATGLRDAHEVAGAGRPPTWPTRRSGPPFVHIDHVLVRGLDVKSTEEIPLSDTDHIAILARLVIPTAT